MNHLDGQGMFHKNPFLIVFVIYSMRYTLIRLEKHPQSIGQIPLPLEKVLIQTSKGFLNSNFIIHNSGSTS